jgi:hypothetical protein
VVIDEFPYLAGANASLPSIIQNAFGPLRAEHDQSQTRLLLCGSALSFMGGLLAGSAALRGRAGLELVVPTLDYLRAAEFWNISDPVLALKVHAITGGTPAYRREFARDDTPAGPGDFDGWVKRTVLNPASPLFREARYLLADEPDVRDIGLYHSVLAAIADGNNTRGGIASYIGRKSGDLAHPLNVLQDCGLVVREPDAFKDNRSTFRIAEPLITFYHAVMRPIWSDLEHTRDASLLWQRRDRDRPRCSRKGKPPARRRRVSGRTRPGSPASRRRRSGPASPRRTAPWTGCGPSSGPGRSPAPSTATGPERPRIPRQQPPVPSLEIRLVSKFVIRPALASTLAIGNIGVCATVVCMAQVDRFSVTMPPDLGAGVRRAAARQGTSVSTWLSEAAADRLRNELLGVALDEWEAEDGAFTEAELDEAAARLGLTRRSDVA